MNFLKILLVGAVTFFLCFLLDKGFTGIFRNKPQHQTGRSVRLSQRYGSIGLLLVVLSVVAIFQGWNSSKILLFCGGGVGLLGVGLIVYYMSFGIYYDEDSFVLTTFGKKSATYAYKAIQGQKLYRIAGGSILMELYLEGGRTVTLQSNMKGIYLFLDAAFSSWCSQKGIEPSDCSFHDPENSCWFPSVEG